jgi:hypothetical protein
MPQANPAWAWHRSRHDGSIDLVLFSTASPANAIDVGRLPNYHRATEPLRCLGFTNYESHEGERPMAIRWRLERPIPAAWLPVTALVG